MESEFILPLQVQDFEDLIDGLLTRNYGLVDDFLPPELVAGLRENLLSHFNSGNMHPAGVGKRFSYQRNLKVRGDLIRWIDNDSKDPWECLFNERVKSFITYLNQTCYTGINDYEFHYAYYEQGSYYQRHLDQFRVDQGRKFSLVTYLNTDWKASDGGQLSLYFEHDEMTIYPQGGRTVFFKSDEIEHEVHLATRPRISIAGWLKHR